MEIVHKAMGAYQTNCYLVTNGGQTFIIDPGMGAVSWVVRHVQQPAAILNTHGHFDHTWSNRALKEHFGIPLYAPKGDAFMIRKDPFMDDTPPCEVDIEVEGDCIFDFDGVAVTFFHFPGHTPGCSAIAIGDALFTGDFVFADSIGRVDFPFSDPGQMRESIAKFLQIRTNYTIYPGHGARSDVVTEQKNIVKWLEVL